MILEKKDFIQIYEFTLINVNKKTYILIIYRVLFITIKFATSA